MPVARCPRCDAPVTIDDADLDWDVECPSCFAVFPAGGPRPRRVARRRPDDEDDEPDDVIADAKRLAFPPGLVGFVAAILSFLVHVADTVLLLNNPQGLQNNPFAQAMGMNAQAPPVEVILAGKGFVILWQVVAAAGCGAMMRLKARGFCTTAMVMHVIPCSGVCCLLTLPVGIWGLVVLARAEVKEGFDLAARGGPDSRSDPWRS